METATETEQDLIARAVQGDGDAFSSLVQPHLNLFTAGIYRILQDAQDTQDALQEALLSIYRNLYRFEGKSRFSTWAYRVCLNEALMLRRSRSRRREDALEDFMPQFAPDGHLMTRDVISDGNQDPSALDKVQQDQIRIRVREGLDCLSDEQRAVFIMRDLEGLDTSEVAKLLGISRGLVRQRLHRARLGLRGILSPLLGSAS